MIQTTLISNIEPGCIFYIIKDYIGKYLVVCQGKRHSYKSAEQALHILSNWVAELKVV